MIVVMSSHARINVTHNHFYDVACIHYKCWFVWTVYNAKKCFTATTIVAIPVVARVLE